MPMERYCRRCRGRFRGCMLCPKCGLQLQDGKPDWGEHELPPLAPPKEVLPWGGRLLLGILLAQGVYFSFRFLANVWLFAVDEAPGFWRTEDGKIVRQVLEATSLLFAGIFVGAGHSLAWLSGILLGMLSSALSLGIEWWTEHALSPSIAAQPLLYSVMGFLGACIGSVIWRPLFIPSPQAVHHVSETSERVPIFWPRVLLGMFVIFCAVMGVLPIRGVLFKLGGYTGGNAAGSMTFVSLQLAMLGILAGGAIAGATRKNGMIQGACAGGLSGVLVVAVYLLLQNQEYAPYQFLLVQLDWMAQGQKTPFHYRIGGLILVVNTVVGAIGGGIGAGLIPPAKPSSIRRISAD